MGGRSPKGGRSGARFSSGAFQAIGESEAKDGVTGDKNPGAPDRIDLDEVFDGTPNEYGDQINSFKKRNGSSLPGDPDNYAKIGRITEKIVDDASKKGFDKEPTNRKEKIFQDGVKNAAASGIRADGIAEGLRGAKKKAVWEFLANEPSALPAKEFNRDAYKQELDALNKLQNSKTDTDRFYEANVPQNMKRKIADAAMDRGGNFFADTSWDMTKVDNSHIHKLNKDGTVDVYDYENKEHPNSYPKAEHEFTAHAGKLGANVSTTIDVGEQTPGTSDALHHFGRELLHSMAEFSPEEMANIKSVHFVTREQFEKARTDPNSPSHSVYKEGVNTSESPVLYHDNYLNLDGKMVVFIDGFQKGDNKAQTVPPENELRKAFHRAIGASMMEKASPEFMAEWEGASMLKRTENGFELKDQANKMRALKTIGAAFRSDYFTKVAEAGGDGDMALRREMEEVIRISKHDDLVALLRDLGKNNPEAHDYLTRMLALASRFQKNLPKVGNRPAPKNRPMPEMVTKYPEELAQAKDERKKAMEEFAANIPEGAMDAPPIGEEPLAVDDASLSEEEKATLGDLQKRLASKLIAMPVTAVGQIGAGREKALKEKGIFNAHDVFESIMNGEWSVIDALIDGRRKTREGVVKNALFQQSIVRQIAIFAADVYDLSGKEMLELQEQIINNYVEGTPERIKDAWKRIVLTRRSNETSAKRAVDEKQAAMEKELADLKAQIAAEKAKKPSVAPNQPNQSPEQSSGKPAAPAKPPRPPKNTTVPDAQPKSEPSDEDDEARKKRIEDSELWF